MLLLLKNGFFPLSTFGVIGVDGLILIEFGLTIIISTTGLPKYVSGDPILNPADVILQPLYLEFNHPAG